MFCTSARVADVTEHSSKILEIVANGRFVAINVLVERLLFSVELIDPVPICLSLLEHIQEGIPEVSQPKSEIPGQSIIGNS